MELKFFLIGMFLYLNCESLTIVENGKSKARIFISEEAPKSVKFASREFQEYIYKITGAPIELIEIKENDNITINKSENYIFIGESIFTKKLKVKSDDLKPDGFKIIVDKNYLVILGRDYKGPPMYGYRHPFHLGATYNEKLGISVYGETGTLYGCYYFLEMLGVRWFMPGEIGEVVPKKKTIKLNRMNIKKEPAFEYRYPYFCAFRKDEEGVKWFKRIGFGAKEVINANHSFYLLQKYKDTHPEIFALIDGERDFNKTCMGKGSLCLSEPNTLNLFVKEISEYFNSHPNIKTFPVVPNDDYRRICECERCKGKEDLSMGEEGKFSDYVWGFVNEVAKKIYETYPDRLILCLAYNSFQSIPKNIKEFSPNVGVVICKERKNYWDNEYKEKMDRLIEEWKEKVKNVYIWEYYNWYDRYSKYYEQSLVWGWSLLGVPVFFFNIIKNDLLFLSKQNVKGEFIEVDDAYYLYPGLMHFTLYVTGKLLWNPYENVNKILEDYCEKFYGPSSKEMKNFYEKSEKLWSQYVPGGFKGELKNEGNKVSVYSKDEIINELLNYLVKAKEKSNGIYRERIDIILNEVKKHEEFFDKIKKRKNIKPLSIKPFYIFTDEGNLEKIPWEKGVLISKFYKSASDEKIENRFETRFLYDSKYLYIELTDFCETEKLHISPSIFPYDDWEIFIYKEGKSSYIQLAFNPVGSYVILLHDNGISKPIKIGELKVYSDITNSDKWTLRIGLPMSDEFLSISKEKIYLNIVRVTFSDISKKINVYCLTPYSTVHEVGSLSEIILEKF